MNPIYTMEAANLFCGADSLAAQGSNHLSIAELQLPTLEEQFQDHRPGGAPVAIEIDMQLNRLEAGFKLLGFNPQVMGLIGSWQPADNFFTAYGLVRDRMTGSAIQAVARLKGRLGRVAPDNYTRGSPLHHGYTIRGITHYEFVLGGTQIYYWDFFTNQRIVNGVDQNADLNNILSTGSVGVGSGANAPLTNVG
jgi:P2 family phage contractile tail tube protein